MPQVVIANRLRDGIVVFLGTDQTWVESLRNCPPAETAEQEEEVLKRGKVAEDNQEVVGPELIEVEIRGGELHAVKMREAIRAAGPTVRDDLGKQAGN